MSQTDAIKPTVYSGLSGLQLPIPKYLFPEPYQNTSRLTYYASLFNSIEINSSFYMIPSAKTMTKWAASVPDYFRFTFKLWKGITHTKRLEFNDADVRSFMTAINGVQDKKGCLLIQLPPSLGSAFMGQLKHLLDVIKESQSEGWKLAVEFRNASWYQESVYDMLQEYHVGLVIHDIPKSATPFLNQQTDFIYLRFHGPTGNYRESYSEDFLNEYPMTIHEWLEAGKSVYVYFNNTMGDAFNNLQTLNKMLQDSIHV